MIPPGDENPRNCVDPDEMNMRWWLSTPGYPEYVLPVAQSTPANLVSRYTRHCSLTMYFEAAIEWVERSTWRWGYSELWEALGAHDRVSVDMSWEVVINRVGWWTWIWWLSEVGDALWGRDRASLEMQLATEIDWTERRTGRPWLSEFGDALEAVIERVGRCTCRLWSSEIRGVLGSCTFGGRRNGSWDSIYRLTCNCEEVESWVQQHLPRDGELAGSGTLAWSGRLSILGWCGTWCMLYSVFIRDHGMERLRGMT